MIEGTIFFSLDHCLLPASRLVVFMLGVELLWGQEKKTQVGEKSPRSYHKHFQNRGRAKKAVVTEAQQARESPEVRSERYRVWEVRGQISQGLETLKDLQFGRNRRILESFKQNDIRFLKDYSVCSFEGRLYGVRRKQKDQRNKAPSINQAIDDGCLDQEGGVDRNEKGLDSGYILKIE